jgi:MOSC domain-containing protein
VSAIDMTNAGVVAGVWRYPVRSLQGERATSIRLAPGPTGVDGDRRWAIVDDASGRVLSGKTVPELLGAGAATVEGRVHVTLPDGATLVAGEPGCDGALSGWLGRAVRLVPAAGTTTSYDMTFDPPNDEADLVEIPMPEGSFVDLAPVHVLTTGSLATAAATHPEGDWDVRRFRPNVLVEATGGDFPEDAWVGHTVAAGDAELAVMLRTVRCALPLRAQPGGPYGRPLARDVGVFRALTAIHDNHLGAYAEVARGGTVAVGDPVRVFSGR